jgi:hypothetical protein
VEPKVAYPADWPRRLVAGSGCEHLDGRYENLAVASTEHRPEKYPELGDTYLSQLLQDGRGAPADRARAREAQVELSVSTFSATVRRAGLATPEPVQSQGSWTCEPSGDLQIQFKAPSEGEWVLAGRRTAVLTLQRAADRSLVVHWDLLFCGLHFSVIPGCAGEDEWLRFRSLD